MNELPQGWDRAPVGVLAALNPKTDAPDETPSGFAPMQMLGTTYLGRLSHEPRAWGDIKKAYTHFRDGDVLLAKVTPCFENGKAGIASGLPSGIGAGSSEFYVLRPNKGVDSRYLLAYLSTADFRRRATMAMTGAVGLRRVPRDFLISDELPVAPSAEQKRIANKLDTVLTRVDAVNTRLARVAPILKRFRQSVLAAAASGTLSADVNRGEWPQPVDLGAYCEVLGGKRLPKGSQLSEADTGFPYVRVTDFHNFGVKVDQVKFVPVDAVSTIARYIIRAVDVYISIAGSIGLVGRVPQHLDGANLTENAARIVVGPEVHPSFLMYQLGSPQLQSQMHEKKIATTQDKLGLFRIKALQVCIPPLIEQTEIVRRVETLFSFADRLEARLQTAQTTTERLTPALLAKAFRGELIPQNPNDEPASELLNRLASSAVPAVKGKRGRTDASH